MKKPLLCILLIAIFVNGCATNEQTGELVGAGGGGLLGGALGARLFGGPAGTILGAGAGAAAGALVGGIIGKSLDDRDREQAAKATQIALNQGQPYRPSSQSSSPTTTQASAPSHRNVSHPVHWASDHSTGASGSSTVIATQPPTAAHGECKTIQEVAYVEGKELSQDTKYCRDANNQWEKA
jgi:surface antigen